MMLSNADGIAPTRSRPLGWPTWATWRRSSTRASTSPAAATTASPARVKATPRPCLASSGAAAASDPVSATVRRVARKRVFMRRLSSGHRCPAAPEYSEQPLSGPHHSENPNLEFGFGVAFPEVQVLYLNRAGRLGGR